MSNYIIGKVVAVSGDKIDVSLKDISTENNVCYGVPETMSINVDTDKGPQPVLIGQPGSFIKISIPTGTLLCIVTDVQMREAPLNTTAIKTALQDDSTPIECPKRLLTCIPVGTLSPYSEFERGTDVLPTVNSDVFAVLPSTIDKVYESYAEGNFSIGELSLIPNQSAKINFDAFLTRHATILGQTGSGKSWTVASFLQNIAKLKQSTVVLFDLHGEYKNAFSNVYADYIDASELELPFWLMNSDELLDLMVDRSESAAPNQIAKFKELLQTAKESELENHKLGIPKITIDTPVYFDFNGIINEFRRLDTEMVEGANKLKQGPLFGQFTRLLMRIDSRLNDKRYDLIFHPQKYKTSASMTELFSKILGEISDNPKKLVIVDISPIPFDVRNSVISLILRCLFDFAYWYKRLHSVAFPIAVFCDEAHAYLNSYDTKTESARLSAERIAKEGRKYGISLTVISQRPREVSATILSQCNSYMCLRITNPDDKSYVKNLLPDSIGGLVNIFSTLRRGECILLGDSVMMPTRIKIDKPNPKPESDDTSFYEEWNKEHKELNIPEVLDAWRKQEIYKA